MSSVVLTQSRHYRVLGDGQTSKHQRTRIQRWPPRLLAVVVGVMMVLGGASSPSNGSGVVTVNT
jgi:hypothetical protein